MSQFDSFTPSFRDSLREMADGLAAKKQVVQVKVAMEGTDLSGVEEVQEKEEVQENQIGK
jgi:hypothetical protein